MLLETRLASGGCFGSVFTLTSSPPYKLSSKAAASLRIFGGMSKRAFMALSKSVLAEDVYWE